MNDAFGVEVLEGNDDFGRVKLGGLLVKGANLLNNPVGTKVMRHTYRVYSFL